MIEKRAFLCAAAAVAVFAGGVFAKGDNFVTYDAAPTLVGMAVGSIADIMGGETDDDFNTLGFGLALQYERAFGDFFSAGGRFAYFGAGFGFSETYTASAGSEYDAKATLEMYFPTYCIEAFGRIYPRGKSYFVNGTLGYGNMGADFSGDILISDDSDEKVKTGTSFSTSASYFKFGMKNGFRWTLGRLVLETAYGWDFSIRTGDGIGTKLSDDLDGTISKALDRLFDILANGIFIGGPRVTLGLGWAF
jgi:hypothetical protein